VLGAWYAAARGTGLCARYPESGRCNPPFAMEFRVYQRHCRVWPACHIVAAMRNQIYNITAAELRGYFRRQLPNLNDMERARWERCIESLAAFERTERNSTHPASTTLQ